MNRLEEIFDNSDSAASYAAQYLKNMADVLKGADTGAIDKLATLIARAADEDKTVFIMGNGGSGAVAAQWVNDLGPNSVVAGKPGFRVMSLTDNASSVTAIGNDASFGQIFEIQLQAFMRPRDVVIALSVSGNSPNILRAADYARANGAFTVGCCGMDGGELKDRCDLTLHFPSTNDEYGPVEDLFSVVMHIVTTYLTMQRGRKLAH